MEYRKKDSKLIIVILLAAAAILLAAIFVCLKQRSGDSSSGIDEKLRLGQKYLSELD